MNKIYGYGNDHINKDEFYYCFDWIQGSCSAPFIDEYDLDGNFVRSEITDIRDVCGLLCKYVDPRLSFDKFDLAPNGINLYRHRLNYEGHGSIILGWNDKYEGNRDQLDADPPGFFRLNKAERDPATGLYVGLNPGFFISVSGDGLRFLGENQFKLFDFLHRIGFHCSRLDVACDVFDPDNPYVPFLIGVWDSINTYKAGDPVITSRMNKINFKIYKENDFTDRDNQVSYNLTCGKTSASSLGYFKLYDKYLELLQNPRHKKKIDDKTTIGEKMVEGLPEKYWYRFEYAIKNKADYVFNEFCEGHLSTCGCFLFCLKSFFKIGFTNKSATAKGTGTVTYSYSLFDAFIELVEKASLYTPNSYLAKYAEPNPDQKASSIISRFAAPLAIAMATLSHIYSKEVANEYLINCIKSKSFDFEHGKFVKGRYKKIVSGIVDSLNDINALKTFESTTYEQVSLFESLGDSLGLPDSVEKMKTYKQLYDKKAQSFLEKL